MLSGSSYESSNKVDYHCGGDEKKLSGEHKMDMNSKHSDISSRKTEVSKLRITFGYIGVKKRSMHFS
jgi:hypothetical protein